MLDLGVPLGRDNVDVKVACFESTISNMEMRRASGEKGQERLTITDVPVPRRHLDAPILEQPLLLKPLPCLLNETVHVLDRHAQVVLVHLAELAGRLRERLAERPERRDLGLVLREDTVLNDFPLEETLQQSSEFLWVGNGGSAPSIASEESAGKRGWGWGAHLVVVILVTPTGLDQDVERPPTRGLTLERRLLPRMAQDQVHPLLVPELERGEDFAERDARLLEDFLDAFKRRHTENCDVDGL